MIPQVSSLTGAVRLDRRPTPRPGLCPGSFGARLEGGHSLNRLTRVSRTRDSAIRGDAAPLIENGSDAQEVPRWRARRGRPAESSIRREVSDTLFDSATSETLDVRPVIREYDVIRNASCKAGEPIDDLPLRGQSPLVQFDSASLISPTFRRSLGSGSSQLDADSTAPV